MIKKSYRNKKAEFNIELVDTNINKIHFDPFLKNPGWFQLNI